MPSQRKSPLYFWWFWGSRLICLEIFSETSESQNTLCFLKKDHFFSVPAYRTFFENTRYKPRKKTHCFRVSYKPNRQSRKYKNTIKNHEVLVPDRMFVCIPGCIKIGRVFPSRLRNIDEYHESIYFQRELRAANRGRRRPIGSLYPQATRTLGVGLMIEFPWYNQSSTISQPG